MKNRNAVAVLIAIGLAACGGSGSPAGASAVTAERTRSTVVLRRTVEAVEAGDQRTIRFDIPRRGQYELTVRWNDPAHSVVAAITRTGCAECPVARSIDRQGEQGREGFISGFSAGGTYELLLKNQGRGTESISVTAELF
jgi:hypothetical protein